MVDDDVRMLRMMQRILELEGYCVATATDGRTALTLLEKRKPDLIILAILMPELDGFQVLNLIRKRSKAPVIMFTGKGKVTTLHDTLILGADAYVKKPTSARELVARIKAKLRRTESSVP